MIIITKINLNEKRGDGDGYFEGIGGAFELDFELHHGGSLAGADDGGQGANGGDGLRQIGVLAPAVELLDDGEGFVGVIVGRRKRRRRRRGTVDCGGLSLSEPLGAHYPELHRSVLVIRRSLPILHSIPPRLTSCKSPNHFFILFLPFIN